MGVDPAALLGLISSLYAQLAEAQQKVAVLSERLAQHEGDEQGRG